MESVLAITHQELDKKLDAKRSQVTCHAMALSVKHCSASPSGNLTESFCKATRRERIVSRRGRRERRHEEQRNLPSERDVNRLAPAPGAAPVTEGSAFPKGEKCSENDNMLDQRE